MNVLHLDSEMSWRGGQNQTKILIEGLVEQNISCHLAANPGSAMIENLKEKIPTLEVKFKTGLSFKAAKIIAEYCRNHSIDLIDVQSARALGTALLVKRAIPHLKLVVHRRLDLPPKKFIFSSMKYKSPLVDRFVAISNAIAQVLLDYGIKPEKVSVVRSAATPQTLNFPDKESAKKAFCEKEAIDPNLCLIGNVAALSPQKDYPTLIRALAFLKREGLPFYCVIAGEGDLSDAMIGMVRDFELDACVQFLGFRKDVADVLQALDVLAMPSKFEGLGTIMLDATQAGCCIVSTKVGGIPEVIHHGETGLLSSVGDPKEFAKLLAKVITSKELREKLNGNAILLVEEEFSPEKMVHGNLEIYKELVGKTT